MSAKCPLLRRDLGAIGMAAGEFNVKSQTTSNSVIPAEAGIQARFKLRDMDSSVRWNDGGFVIPNEMRNLALRFLALLKMT